MINRLFIFAGYCSYHGTIDLMANAPGTIKVATVIATAAAIIPSMIAFIWWAVDVQKTIHELKRQADITYPIILEYNVQKKVAEAMGEEFKPFAPEETEAEPLTRPTITNRRLDHSQIEKIRTSENDRLQRQIRPKASK